MTTLCMTDLKRSQESKPAAVRGAIAVRPNFSPELVGIEMKSNFERLREYEQKLENLRGVA